jgi:hypothetical protein
MAAVIAAAAKLLLDQLMQVPVTMKVLSAALGIVLWVGANSAHAADVAPPAGAVCTAFSQLALDKLPQQDGDFAASSPQALSVWRRLLANPVPAVGVRPEAEIRLFTMDGFVPNPHLFEVLGWRLNDHWRLYARSKSVEGGAAGHRPRWTGWTAKRLLARDAADIDAELDGPCLWSSPRFLPSELPLSGGGQVAYYDSPTTFLAVRSRSRTWEGLAFSWRLGPPAKVRAALMAAAFHSSRCVDHANLREPAPPCPPGA